MKLKKHAKGIMDVDGWLNECPPKKGEKQWVSGRSAMELAKYITKNLPCVPSEIEDALKPIVSVNSQFEWDAEHVTALPGRGEGRNHDAILYNEDILVTIEAKADETLGNLVGEEIQKASVNKLYRISELLRHIFKADFKKYGDLRYQLITAAVGTALEAKNRGLDTAVMLVIVFRTDGKVDEEKLARNHDDIKNFLIAVNAHEENGFAVIPNNMDVKLYFKEIII